MTVKELKDEMERLIQSGHENLPVVIQGPTDYGTPVGSPKKVTFNRVFDGSDWVSRSTEAIDLFTREDASLSV